MTDDDLFAVLARAGLPRLHVVTDAASGLRAVIAVHDTSLGPAAGGVRTQAYAGWADAVADAARLASRMSDKCALAGLPAGGGKAVVLDHPGLDRPRAFAALGRAVEELGGLFRTAGDLGTSAADLAAMATTTRFVHTDERGLGGAAARGLLRCLEAAAARRGRGLAGLRVAVQGAGMIGAACVRALAAAGAQVLVADVDPARAQAAAAHAAGGAHPVQVVSAAAILSAPVDVVAPCALGGVIDAAAADALDAWAVVGAANGVLAGADGGLAVAERLRARAILHVPDEIASAGAVVDGLGKSILGLDLGARAALVDRLGATAAAVLDEAERAGTTPLHAARARARALRLAGPPPR